MEARVAVIESRLADYDGVVARLAKIETELADLNYIEEDFGRKLKDRLDLMQAEITTKADQLGADMEKLFVDAKNKFNKLILNLLHSLRQPRTSLMSWMRG